MTANIKEVLEFGKFFETDGSYSEILKKLGNIYGLEQKQNETTIEFHQRVHYYRLTHLPLA